jgi:hypothetical protein
VAGSPRRIAPSAEGVRRMTHIDRRCFRGGLPAAKSNGSNSS